jgi:hypothetical protein
MPSHWCTRRSPGIHYWSSVPTSMWTIVHSLTIAMSFFGLLFLAGIFILPLLAYVIRRTTRARLSPA